MQPYDELLRPIGTGSVTSRGEYNLEGNRRNRGNYEVAVTCDPGNKILGYYDGVKKIEATDDTFHDAGKVGLWTKADSLTYFDDLKVVVK
jgi:hypothetical protein